MNRPGIRRAALTFLAVIALASGTARADDPKTLKVNTPNDGAAVAARPGVESLRYSCTGNRTVTVTGKVLTSPDGYVFRASGNCTLKLKDVVVSGHGIITANGNAAVTVQDCTFTGASVAIEASGNAELNIENTVITAPAGLVASGSAEVRLVDSTITAAETAIQTGGTAVVELKRTVTSGKRVQRGSSEINEK
jgi:hypothetical protein